MYIDFNALGFLTSLNKSSYNKGTEHKVPFPDTTSKVTKWNTRWRFQEITRLATDSLGSRDNSNYKSLLASGCGSQEDCFQWNLWNCWLEYRKPPVTVVEWEPLGSLGPSKAEGSNFSFIRDSFGSRKRLGANEKAEWESIRKCVNTISGKFAQEYLTLDEYGEKIYWGGGHSRIHTGWASKLDICRFCNLQQSVISGTTFLSKFPERRRHTNIGEGQNLECRTTNISIFQYCEY